MVILREAVRLACFTQLQRGGTRQGYLAQIKTGT
jgi:hypothetical protein